MEISRDKAFQRKRTDTAAQPKQDTETDLRLNGFRGGQDFDLRQARDAPVSAGEPRRHKQIRSPENTQQQYAAPKPQTEPGAADPDRDFTSLDDSELPKADSEHTGPKHTDPEHISPEHTGLEHVGPEQTEPVREPSGSGTRSHTLRQHGTQYQRRFQEAAKAEEPKAEKPIAQAEEPPRPSKLTFAFEGIPYGHWIVAEISAPALYTVSPEQHHIYIGVDGQCIEIRVDDTLIRGSVQLMKTEAVGEPSPVEPDGENAFMRFLPGAVFELYEDTNGNKELDNEDTLLGELNETETGFHEAGNLLAKGYFVKEKTAPEGYKPDENAYYFEIAEDGQTVIIENGEAGRGFTNEAYRGNLKIVKDSSDGRKDGFSIEVKSADGVYCETFVTPADGVIEVKGLRVGTYTVTEISNRASRGYIIPDAVTVEIKLDQLVTVRLFNEKPEEPTTPEIPTTPTTPGKPVPQTGDDASLFVWIGVLACSLAGGALFLFLTGRKGKHLKITAKDKAVRIGVPVLCVILALGSGFMLLREIGQYRESADAYHSLESYVDMPKETEPAADGAEDPSVESDAAEETAGAPAVSLPSVDFDALREISPDIIAWLTLEDTVINYPVTQADDNDYYLHHLHDKTYSKVGCLFADYENAADFSDRNTIIYGHNMRDGSMFASIKDYADQAYYDAHPRMFLITPEQGFVMEIFSAFVADPGESGNDTSPWRLNWQDDGGYAAWLEAMAGRSVIQSDVAVNSGDRVLTLSTCTNDSAHRFIVMGKLTAVN